MKRCAVFMAGQDGRTHTIAVDATSVFDAAAQATRGWALFWWYRPDAVIEVRSGEEVWRVLLQIRGPKASVGGEGFMPGKNYAATPKIVWMN
jgi:phage terminase large subunit-like protein